MNFLSKFLNLFLATAPLKNISFMMDDWQQKLRTCNNILKIQLLIYSLLYSTIEAFMTSEHIKLFGCIITKSTPSPPNLDNYAKSFNARSFK